MKQKTVFIWKYTLLRNIVKIFMKYFVLNWDKTACLFVFLSYNSVLYNKVHYFILQTIQAVSEYFRLLWFCHVIGGNTAFLRNLQFSAYYHSSGADAISGYSFSECCFLKNLHAISSIYSPDVTSSVQVPALRL
jgi:hypothetical protein